MIGSLTGTVADVGTDGVLLDVNGVGYHLSVLPSVAESAVIGKTVTLRTHLHVRDDALALYGFLSAEELRFFRLLLTVPGIGPRTAMGVLAVAPPEILTRAVMADDATFLTTVSGIGRKTAERVVTELKARLEREPAASGEGTPHGEIIQVLIALGYTRSQAREAIRALPAELQSLEEGVRTALRTLGQHAAPGRRPPAE